MTDAIRAKYIESAIEKQLLPVNAHRMENVISLQASDDPAKPIQFWQLYSVLGKERILDIVSRFYERVYSDDAWFSSVFSRIGSKEHHITSQGQMWLDAMGGGHYYHGAEFRLNFHHTHNAMELMNDKGAQRWISLMNSTLNDPDVDYTDDERVRPAINTFLNYFMDKYAEQFDLEKGRFFGETNPGLIQRINFMNMTSDAVESLSEQELKQELTTRGIDVATFKDKSALVNKALSL